MLKSPVENLSESKPVAVFLVPVALDKSAEVPTATLSKPVVRLGITFAPRPTFPLPVRPPLKRLLPAAALLLASQ